jgi:hypothetical protein
LPIAFGLLALWLVAFKLTVAQPSHADEILFKSPALSLASGTGWRAPEERGYFGWQPPLDEVFACYPPLYSFLFACCIKVVGFSWRVCAAYDVLIHLLLSGVVVCFLRSAVPARPVIAWLAGMLFLLSGYPPRPDRLAMIFGYSSLILLLSAHGGWSGTRLAFVGALFGLCLGTSFPCAVAFGPLIMAVVLAGHPGMRQTAARLGIIGAVALVVVLGVIAPVVLSHPGAVAQNLGATAHTISAPFIYNLTQLVKYHHMAVLALVALLLPGVWAWIPMLGRPQTPFRRAWLLWYGAACVPLAVFLMKSAYQGAYYWFLMPWLAAALFQPEIHRRVFHRLAPGWLVVAFLPLLAFEGRTVAATLLEPAGRRLPAFQQPVEELIPAGASVLVGGEFWWLLAGRNQTYDFAAKESLSADLVDYVIITGAGSGSPGTHQPLPRFMGDHYIEIANLMNTSRPTLFGLPLSRSSFSPAPVVFRRKDLR